MANKVSMCNAALTKLGVDRITALTDDTEAGRVCSVRFQEILEYMLERYDWTFATGRAQLAALSDAPDFEYTYQFQLPTDCLHVRSEYNDYPYKKEGRLLLADSTPLQIIYTKNVTDMNELSPGFREAFAFYLASELAVPLVGSRALSETKRAEYKLTFGSAIAKDAQQDTQPEQDVGDWISIRG